MAVHNCVEPGKATANDHPVVSAAAADTIVFPAVDSCFAIALKLKDGTLLGGHVPTLWDDKAFALEFSKFLLEGRKGGAYDPNSEGMPIALDNILAELDRRRAGEGVALAVTLGDPEWYDLWDKRVGKVGYPKQIRYRKGPGPRNLVFDGAAQSISVQALVGGHYATDPTKTRAFNQGTINAQPVAC